MTKDEAIEPDSHLGTLREDLKPCPFCGAKEARVYSGKNHADCLVYWVECGDYEHCKVRPSTFQEGTEKKAIKIWESRK